jgi:hypothetical protein
MLARLGHLKSYTLPYLESGQYEKARCDLFGSFVGQENEYFVAASKAVVEIKSVQRDVEMSLSAASNVFDSCIFTSMPVFALFMFTVGGCFFVTDAQRARLAAFWKFVIKSWNRFAHKNRIYDIGSGDAVGSDGGVRLEVQGSPRCDDFIIPCCSACNVRTGPSLKRPLNASLRKPPHCF